MPPAIIGGAIAAAGAVGGAVLGGKSVGKAADATTAAADRSAAVVERNYDLSSAALQPWQAGGLQAFNTVNSFLGLSPTQQTLPTQQPDAMAQFQPGTGTINGLMTWRQRAAAAQGLPTAQPTQQTAQPMTQYQTSGVNPQDGFRQYIQNSDYGFKFGEGANAVNSGYAGAGTLQSGAAMKALEEYRQNLQQGYRGEYLGALGNQQSLGLTAAQAQAGVGGSAANSLANIYTNQGSNLANAALVGGQNNAALVNSLATIGAGIFGGKK